MDANTIALVQGSWQQVLPIRHTAGRLFYDHLFDADPSLRPMFRGDLEQQAAKLVHMITAAVNQLGRLDELLPVLRQLGQRHGGYGVQPAHYETVGRALMKTLQQGLGEDFTDDVRAAWAAVYATLASVMIEAATPVAA